MAGDHRWMALALSLGRRGLGRTWPNPAVGCVIIADGRVVGRGWTQDGGNPHAEKMALAQAGARAKGATVYVTLEPCSHTGRSSPCADALVAAGVKRVVVAISDPNPEVNGQGIDRLRDAGISVDIGEMAAEATRDHVGFLNRIGEGRPFVSLKLASTIDGRIATASGESQWITGPHARRIVHQMRAKHDAVLIGAGTARADDPMLTIRDIGVTHQPVRVVVSRNIELPETGKLAQSAREIPLWICHDAEEAKALAWEKLGAKMLRCGSQNGGVDMSATMAALAGAGITRVFCEGGGQLAASLLRADLVDQLIAFNAGKVLGADAKPAIADMNIDLLSQAPRFELESFRSASDDSLTLWRRR